MNETNELNLEQDIYSKYYELSKVHSDKTKIIEKLENEFKITKDKIITILLNELDILIFKTTIF